MPRHRSKNRRIDHGTSWVAWLLAGVAVLVVFGAVGGLLYRWLKPPGVQAAVIGEWASHEETTYKDYLILDDDGQFTWLHQKDWPRSRGRSVGKFVATRESLITMANDGTGQRTYRIVSVTTERLVLQEGTRDPLEFDRVTNAPR